MSQLRQADSDTGAGGRDARARHSPTSRGFCYCQFGGVQRFFGATEGHAATPFGAPVTWHGRHSDRRGIPDYQQAQQNLLMARSFVVGPAIGLIVLSILGIIACIILLALMTLGIAVQDAIAELEGPGSEAASTLAELVGNFLGLTFSLAMSILTLHRIDPNERTCSYGWAMTAAILSVIPLHIPLLLSDWDTTRHLGIGGS